MKHRLAAGAAMLMLLVGLPGPASNAEDAAAKHDTPAELGSFGQPFAEPGKECQTTKDKNGNDQKVCKPAAVSVIVLPDGRILYWDGLEGFENIHYGTVPEAGDAAVNDQSRVLTLGRNPAWAKPTPNDGGANPDGYENEYIFPDAPAPID